MSNKYIVIEKYEAQSETPIKLFAGESVTAGERYTGDAGWKGWIWCENTRGEKGGGT